MIKRLDLKKLGQIFVEVVRSAKYKVYEGDDCRCITPGYSIYPGGPFKLIDEHNAVEGVMTVEGAKISIRMRHKISELAKRLAEKVDEQFPDLEIELILCESSGC